VLALVLGIFANTGTALQAYRNCQNIEKVKTRIRLVLNENIVRLESGDLDAEYQRIFGSHWEEAKKSALASSNRQLHQFDAEACRFFIR
jgi:hypothetical protein